MARDFLNMDYLRYGNPKQRRVFDLLRTSTVMEVLRPFDAALAGTIPLGIDTDSSDLDLLCCFSEQAAFIEVLIGAFGRHPDFQWMEQLQQGLPSVVSRFGLEEFEVEVFGQPRPVTEQWAYRHLLIEHRILEERGEEFRGEVIALKKHGIKTEPAFARLLGLEGDPYEALLQLE